MVLQEEKGKGGEKEWEKGACNMRGRVAAKKKSGLCVHASFTFCCCESLCWQRFVFFFLARHHTTL